MDKYTPKMLPQRLRRRVIDPMNAITEKMQNIMKEKDEAKQKDMLEDWIVEAESLLRKLPKNRQNQEFIAHIESLEVMCEQALIWLQDLNGDYAINERAQARKQRMKKMF